MTYIFMAFVLVIIASYYYLLVHRKKVLLTRMISGIDMVKMGVYTRLKQRFEVKYGEEKARFLSGAVTNELFSGKPANPDAEQFLKSNMDIVEQELSKIRDDQEMCKVVTQAIRVKMVVSSTKGKHVLNPLLDHVKKLKKFGIFVSGGEAPSPETFLAMAYKFFKSTTGE